ncbi:MAG: AraC family transcriptional regulator [Bacteroidales bacterium]|nr:AraC family transcriptional regulator [Bacteroidales bacterium]MDT8432980.1 AraC family transcriptional regulator [Bacteroidales bacterium]
MIDFFKYLTASESDAEWGMFLTVAGKAEIPKHREYPLREHGHPKGYNFQWEKGRELQEYQVHYFTEGEGILENEFGNFKIVPGSIMVTYPGVWHRFRPLKSTGWVEHYVGFEGALTDRFFNRNWFHKDKPVINCKMREELIDTYYKIFDLVQEEKPSFQFVASGMIIKLLGYIASFQTQSDFHGKQIRSVIEDVRFLLRKNVEENIDFEKIAVERNVGYSYFRKMFKRYTGISPKQYHLQLKIIRAKELLINTNLPIKEIADILGFQSTYYFSRVFKDKTGRTPSQLRIR